MKRAVAAFIVFMAASFGPSSPSSADPPSAGPPPPGPSSTAPQPRVGDRFTLARRFETKEEKQGESSGSSTDRDALIERVVEVRGDGLVIDYDLPEGAKPDERARQWEFPVRIFEPNAGPPRLLDPAGMSRRVEAWLKRSKLKRSACGRWGFTWTAYQIECDPQSVLKVIAVFRLSRGTMRAGDHYQDAHAAAPAVLTQTSVDQDGTLYTAQMTLDPDLVRQERAESDVVVGAILQEPITLKQALKNQAAMAITGTITTLFETDTSGAVVRRTTLTKMKIKDAHGTTETLNSTEVLERTRAVAKP
jgi:hypothetical protein